ncbi:hypothetical protein BZL29_5313 [Mycobacterium kansasii]|uniref:Uncharacterized protein n=1 Tax=Mycobacterium kansasii TaxID=1768 RepID=A0A1V3X108_MYCKA|nr:hypothetical protein BZL29_5313 [Mycobacterium kansasii]
MATTYCVVGPSRICNTYLHRVKLAFFDRISLSPTLGLQTPSVVPPHRLLRGSP